jgi:F-type H+-transporting ATPase subunit gamma
LYAEYSWDILTSIAQNNESITHPLFVQREIKDNKENILLILITSNRGLCGAYNTQITKKVLSLLQNTNKGKNDLNIDIVTVGKKGDVMMRRIGKKIIASFFELPSNISLADIIPISELAINEYILGHYDKILVAYTDFVSALSQKPNIRQVIPVSKTSLKELLEEALPMKGEISKEGLPMHPESKIFPKDKIVDYLFEGNQENLIKSLAEKITRMQIYQMILESNASEQSSRMMAMKNASEAAGEMIDDLTLVFNKARQSNITREISEISAGMASVS